MRVHLCGALELAPSLLQASAGHVASTIGHGSGAAVGSGAGRRVLAAETVVAAGVIAAADHVAGATTTDVVDGGGAAEVALKLFVEAEDGALGAGVDVAGTTTASGEGRRGARVKAS